MASVKSLRIFPKGYKYCKSSDCRACPICERENAPESGFLSMLGAPATRALQNSNIITLYVQSRDSEKELLQLHGIGKTSIPKLKKVLAEQGPYDE